MKRSLLISTLLVLFCALPLLAQTADTSIAVSQLKTSPFTSGPLKITFDYLKGKALIADASHTIGFQAGIKIQVENMSNDFAVFDPRLLSVVDTNGYQVDILGLDPNDNTSIFPAERRRIAPKATIKGHYILTDKIELPARIYYEDKLLTSVKE